MSKYRSWTGTRWPSSIHCACSPHSYSCSRLFTRPKAHIGAEIAARLQLLDVSPPYSRLHLLNLPNLGHRETQACQTVSLCRWHLGTRATASAGVRCMRLGSLFGRVCLRLKFSLRVSVSVCLSIVLHAFTCLAPLCVVLVARGRASCLHSPLFHPILDA